MPHRLVMFAGEIPGGADTVRRAEFGRRRGARRQVPPVARVQRARREPSRARRPRGHRAPDYGPARPSGYTRPFSPFYDTIGNTIRGR